MICLSYLAQRNGSCAINHNISLQNNVGWILTHQTRRCCSCCYHHWECIVHISHTIRCSTQRLTHDLHVWGHAVDTAFRSSIPARTVDRRSTDDSWWHRPWTRYVLMFWIDWREREDNLPDFRCTIKLMQNCQSHHWSAGQRYVIIPHLQIPRILVVTDAVTITVKILYESRTDDPRIS